jgi:hypothetical protein
MPLRGRALALLFSLAASPAMAFSDATQIPPPPYLVQPIAVLLIFLAIFVGAAWSLSSLMGISSRPVRLNLWKWRRRRRI